MAAAGCGCNKKGIYLHMEKSRKMSSKLHIALVLILIVQYSQVYAKPPGVKPKAPPDDASPDTHKEEVKPIGMVEVKKKEEPAVKKEEHAVKKEEPVVKKEKPVVKKEEPVVKKEEPVVKKEESVVKKEEPVVKKEEPVVKKEEPVVKKEEPVVKKEEPVEHVESKPAEREKVEAPKVETEDDKHEEHKVEERHEPDHEDIRHEERKDKEHATFLFKNPHCQQDIEKYCGKIKKSRHADLQIIRCLQDALEREDDVSEDCEQQMWDFKLNLTKNPLLDSGARKLCPSTIQEIHECEVEHATNKEGFLASCLVEHRDRVTEEKCHKFLKTLATVIFSDYRLLHMFYKDCDNDVKKLKCGMVQTKESKDEEKQHEQGDVVGCLNSELEKVTDKCKKQLTRIAELQADDYHLDRPLFYACQEARERYCHDTKSGEGQVYKCLLQHINEEMMPEACQAKLHERQSLMQESKKTNYALWHHCKKDFEDYGCEKIGLSEHGEASNLLLCLQEQVAEGRHVSTSCKGEMRDVATMIFDNYKISPIIVAGCDAEINSHCKAYIGTTDNGAMMDCLMTIAANNDSLSKTCFESVTMVLKETGAGNNYKVDGALYMACQQAISSLCDHKDDTLIMGCLMDNVHNPKMPESCSTQVFHLQYFLSRDFRLDTSLYQDCQKDAEKICHAADFKSNSETTENSMPHNFVIACLYRNIIMKDEVGVEVNKKCQRQVRRVMHARAKSVKLLPEIEQSCLADLGNLCRDKVEREEELECLQENYESLSSNCKKAVKDFSQLESRDFDLNYHLATKCGPVVTKLCKSQLEEEDGEKVIPCLIENKNDILMDPTCADAIEHWQLLEMKDIVFSPAFNKECLDDIRKNCQNAKTKTEAIKCLSQSIVTDASKVKVECRTQLKKELIKQTENIKLMPELYEACQKDILKWCPHVPPGGAQLEECLRKNHKKLQSSECKSLLFEEETAESQDPDLDYRLMHVCKPMIKRYCMSYSQPQEVVECLRQNTHDRDMSPECREIIKERQIEQAESFVLDAELSNYCALDAKTYCKKELDRAKLKGSDEAGEVFGCLVDQLMRKVKLSSDCENFIRRREAEAAMDLELNPQIFQHCHDEMSKVCPNTQPDEMLDCLKANVPKIKSKACVEEVKKLIVEGIEDVHVDPHLEQTCSRDIHTFCQDMPKKSGNVVLCLIDVHKAKNLHLQAECDNFLTKRLSLYNAAKVNPAVFDSISTVLEAVAASPNKNSVYITVMLILGVLFLGGIMFGRVTKKAHIDMKNR